MSSYDGLSASEEATVLLFGKAYHWTRREVITDEWGVTRTVPCNLRLARGVSPFDPRTTSLLHRAP